MFSVILSFPFFQEFLICFVIVILFQLLTFLVSVRSFLIFVRHSRNSADALSFSTSIESIPIAKRTAIGNEQNYCFCFRSMRSKESAPIRPRSSNNSEFWRNCVAAATAVVSCRSNERATAMNDRDVHVPVATAAEQKQQIILTPLYNLTVVCRMSYGGLLIDPRAFVRHSVFQSFCLSFGACLWDRWEVDSAMFWRSQPIGAHGISKPDRSVIQTFTISLSDFQWESHYLYYRVRIFGKIKRFNTFSGRQQSTPWFGNTNYYLELLA